MTSTANIGIETTYQGTRFRSRLEARWAAFFDIAEWRWDYEPIDFPGWIPDFAIYDTNGTCAVYAEVKPLHYGQPWGEVAQKIDRAYPIGEEPHISKAPEVLILLAGPHDGAGFGCCLGYLRDWEQWSDCIGGRWWKESDYSSLSLNDRDDQNYYSKQCGRRLPPFDFFHENGSWEYRISRVYDGDHHMRVDFNFAVQMWREAGNRVKWEKKQ